MSVKTTLHFDGREENNHTKSAFIPYLLDRVSR